MAQITYIDVPPDMSKPVTIKIDMGKLQLGGMLHINILQSDAELHYPDIQVFEVTEKLHTFVFMPPNPGIYTFTIKYNHKKVGGSPLELNLKHPDGKLISIVRKPNSKLGAGQPITIKFDSFLGGRGEFTAECSGSKVGIIPVSIDREGISNVYGFKFLPPQEDIYKLKAWYSGQDVYGSPYTIDLTPPRPDLVKCTNISFPEDRDGPLEMDICTAGCGVAKLTSACRSSSGKKFAVQLDKVSPDNYHLTVEDLPKEDDITVDVKYGGKHVKDSPFVFKPKIEEAVVELDMLLEAGANPDRVKVGEIHKPKTAGQGNQVWVDADCSDAGPGILSAECFRKNKEPMDVTIKELETKGSYHVLFDAKDHDTYTLSLLFNGQAVPGGFFEMDILQPPDPAKVKIGEPHVPDSIGSEDAWIDLDCSEAGHGEVQAKCSREGTDYPVDISALDSLDHYRVKFTPDQQDIYNLSLLFAEEPIPGGIMDITIPPPDSAKVKSSELHVPKFAGDEPAWLDVDCSNAGYGILTAKCTRRNGTDPVDVSVNQLGSSSNYHVEFIPEHPDVYTLSLYFSGDPVPDGSFDVEALQKPDPAKVKLGDLHAPQFAGDEPLWIEVDCSEAGAGELTADWSGRSAGPLEVSMEELATSSKYRLTFQANHPDTYSLQLMFAGEYIPEGTFVRDMFQRPDATKVKLGDLHTPEFAGDEPLWIDVDCSKAGAGELTAEWTGKELGPSKVLKEELEPKGNYRMKFPVEHSDRYTLSLFFDEQPVPEGSFEMTMHDRPDPSKVTFGEFTSPGGPGEEPAYMDVDYSAAGFGELTAEWKGERSGPLEVTLDKIDPKGKDRLLLPVDSYDRYTLSLFFAGQPVPGGTFEMDMFQPPNAEMVKVGELHAPEFAGSEPIWVDVDCSEAGSGELTAEWIGRDSGPSVVSKEELETEGHYRMKFPVEYSDTYTLSLFFGGEPVPGGSHEMTMQDPPDPSKVKLGKLITPQYAGAVPLWMDIDYSEAGAGKVTAEWKGKICGSLDVTEDMIRPSGKIRMLFPACEPDYYTLSLFFAGQPIPGGSFAMDLLQEPDPEKVKVGELHSPEYAGDDPLWVDVDCSEAGAGQLTAEWSGKDSGPLEASIEKLGPKGMYRVKFPTDHPDTYELSLLFHGQPVPGGTCEMDILQRPDPSKVKLGELHTPEFAGDEPLWIDVDCSEAGTGELDAKWTSMTAGPLEVEMDALEPKGMYRMKFPASHPGSYSLSLLFGGEPVPDGSYLVEVLPGPDAEKVNVGDLHIPEFAGAEPLWLDVDCSEAGTGELTAEWTGSNGRVLDVSKEELTPKGNYRMKFPADQPDVYSLSLFFSGQPVSSFVMDIPQRPDPSKVKLGNLHVPEFAGDESVWLEVDCSDAGHGSLTAQCVRKGDSNATEEVNVEDGPSKGSYLVKFVPSNPGIHTLSLFFHDQPVPGGSHDIEMFARPDASKVKLLGGIHVPEAAGEGDVWIDVDCSDAGQGELSALYKGGNQERAEAIVPEALGKSNYRIKFTPERADIYTMTLFFGGESVPNGSFEVNLLPKSDAKLVRHLGTFIPDDVGDPVILKFDASKAGPGSMRGRVSGVSHAGTISSRVDLIDEDDIIYHLMFIPEGADTYNVDVYWSDESIPGSPIYVKIIYADEVILGDPVVHTQDVHQSVQIPVDTDIAGPGDLTVFCTGEKTGPHDVEVVQDSSVPTKYTIYFHPTVLDLYLLRVYFSGTEVKDSPIEVDLRPQLVDESAVVDPQKLPDVIYTVFSDNEGDDKDKPASKSPSRLQLYVGEPMSLLINNAEGELSASAFGERTGKSTISVHSSDDRGNYQVKFQPSQPDVYNINIRLDQEHVSGSPYIVEYLEREPSKDIAVTVQPGGGADHYQININPDDSSEEGSKTSLRVPTRFQMYVGDPLVILIDDLDGEVGDLVASAVGERTGEWSITTRPTERSGSCRVEFQPTEADTYTVEVSHLKNPIPGSPFIIEFINREPVLTPEPPSPSDPPIAIPEHPIHKPYLIKCVGNWDNIEEILAYAIHDDSCIRDTLRIRKRRGKKPLLVFYPKKLGVHIIHIKRGSTDVQGSPFKLRIVKSGCRFMNMPDEAYVGDLVEIKVGASDAGEGDLHVLATVPIGGKGTVFNHSEDGEGMYTIHFTPQVAGRHKIEVKWAGEPIEGSPAVVNVLEPTDEIRQGKEAASKVYILKEDKTNPESKPFNRDRTHFQVNTEKAGKGELTLKSQGPSSPRINIFKEEDGLYSCHVKPTVSGKYEILILWNGIPIPGNPYRMKYLAERMYTIHNLDLEVENFMLQQPSRFFVDCGSFKGSLDVSAMPSDAADISIDHIKDNIYSVEITPKEAGNHDISVKFADRHVLQSPYHVQFDAPDRPIIEDKMSRLSDLNLVIGTAGSTLAIPSESPEELQSQDQCKVQAQGPGLLEGVIGQEGNFIINTESAGEGKLQVSVQGPKGSFHTRVRRHPDNNRILLARYDPTHIGEYSVSILWREKHIEGSPFAVNVRGQKKRSSD